MGVVAESEFNFSFESAVPQQIRITSQNAVCIAAGREGNLGITQQINHQQASVLACLRSTSQSPRPSNLQIGAGLSTDRALY